MMEELEQIPVPDTPDESNTTEYISGSPSSIANESKLDEMFEDPEGEMSSGELIPVSLETIVIIALITAFFDLTAALNIGVLGTIGVFFSLLLMRWLAERFVNSGDKFRTKFTVRGKKVAIGDAIVPKKELIEISKDKMKELLERANKLSRIGPSEDELADTERPCFVYEMYTRTFIKRKDYRKEGYDVGKFVLLCLDQPLGEWVESSQDEVFAHHSFVKTQVNDITADIIGVIPEKTITVRDKLFFKRKETVYIPYAVLVEGSKRILRNFELNNNVIVKFLATLYQSNIEQGNELEKAKKERDAYKRLNRAGDATLDEYGYDVALSTLKHCRVNRSRYPKLIAERPVRTVREMLNPFENLGGILSFSVMLVAIIVLITVLAG